MLFLKFSFILGPVVIAAVGQVEKHHPNGMDIPDDGDIVYGDEDEDIHPNDMTISEETAYENVPSYEDDQSRIEDYDAEEGVYVQDLD